MIQDWLCCTDISYGFKSFCAQSMAIIGIKNGIWGRGDIVPQVCLKNLHIPKSKYEVLLFLKRKKKIQCVSVHMKKHFRTENMACKEERGKCVIFNGKNSCLDQIETRWERKNQKSKAETHSGKRHQRRNVLPSQRRGYSQPFLPVVLEHVAHRNSPSPRTWKKNWGEGTKQSKEPVPETIHSHPTGLRIFIRLSQNLAGFSAEADSPQEWKDVSVCLHSRPNAGR